LGWIDQDGDATFLCLHRVRTWSSLKLEVRSVRTMLGGGSAHGLSRYLAKAGASLLFSIKAGKEAIKAEGLTHESTLTAYLMKRRRSLISARDPAKADQLFSDLPKKAIVSGGGASKAYRVKWEKVGGRKSRFPGARFVFSVEESGLGRLTMAFRGRR
jgi:hypothetical protein